MSAHVEKFENGYGISVCIGAYAEGEFNVAVIDATTGKLLYDTPITGDTVRCSSIHELMLLRDNIADLPNRTLQFMT